MTLAFVYLTGWAILCGWAGAATWQRSRTDAIVIWAIGVATAGGLAIVLKQGI